METTAWIIGRNGMLGTSIFKVLSELKTNIFIEPDNFNWQNPATLHEQLCKSIELFADNVTQRRTSWEIYWAAGVGTMASTRKDMAQETEIFKEILRLIGNESRLIGVQGTIIFSSSAGAIFSGSTELIINENTKVAPTTSYALAKIEQENLIEKFVKSYQNIIGFIARISTLYGLKQSITKKQGLITHIARCLIAKKTISIYVPLDTMRDYISSDDAARIMVKSLRLVDNDKNFIKKVVASERPTTIAEIIGIFKRLHPYAPPRIIKKTVASTSAYGRALRYKSNQNHKFINFKLTSLEIGISRVIAHELVVYIQRDTKSIISQILKI